MSYLTQEELKRLNLKYCGKNVMVSSLARIYAPEKVELHDYCRIDDFCVLTGRVTLGRHVHLALYTHIGGTDFGVTMEDHSECAYRCAVITHSSDYTLATLHSPSVPEAYKSGRAGAVLIRKYCLIGYNSLVMPGVTLEEGCSFGAFSYINKSTQPWGLYSGNPAVRIRENSKECVRLAQKLEKEQR